MRFAGIAAVVLALALPSTALAQGAGDDQYSDPFQGQENDQPEPAPTPEPQAPAPAPAAPAAPSAPAPAPAPAAQPAAAEQLPYTGADAGLLAIGGALLLAGGVALRVRLRDER